jgi:hypothetical protein
MKTAAKILCIIALIIGIIWATVGFFGSWVGGAVIATGEEVFANDSVSADATMGKSVNFMLKFIGSFIVVIIGGVLGIVGSKKAPSQMKPIILGILTYISGWVLFPLNNYVAAAIYLVAGLLLVLAGLTTKIQIENQTKEDEKRKKMMLALISIGIMLLVTIGGCFMLTSNPKKQTDIKNETTLEENDLSELEQDTFDESQIIDYSVEKISGSHKYGGATDIEYKSLAQLIDETTKKSEKEMWGKEQLERRINSLRNSAIGGRIILEIERKTLEEAKTNQYTFIIKDLDENEIYRKRFESTETPEMPDWGKDYWWNLDLCDIEKRIKSPFYVYIIEPRQDAPFKFKVTAEKKYDVHVADLKVDFLSISGDLGQITFSQEGQTIFYYDEQNKKGKIKINGNEYVIDKCSYDKQANSFFLSGNQITINCPNLEYYEDEGGDCMYGKFSVVTITLGSNVLTISNVEVQDCPLFD